VPGSAFGSSGAGVVPLWKMMVLPTRHFHRTRDRERAAAEQRMADDVSGARCVHRSEAESAGDGGAKWFDHVDSF
jgi:hypothetical protein